MKTISSSELQARFGEALDQAKRDPIAVTQYGRPVVVMMGYDEARVVLRLRAGQKLADFLKDLPVNAAAQALSDEDITRLVHALRA